MFNIYLNSIFNLFFERGEGERGTEISVNVWLPLAQPYWGPDPQPRHVP